MLVVDNSKEEINKALLALQKQIESLNDILNKLKKEIEEKK